jgi:holliday junction DNA helicase RuvA
MFAFLKGELVVIMPTNVVVEANGIGYLIYIPANLFGKLPQTGNKVLLHTSYIVREQSHTLYGFLSVQERDLFETLMGVTGIGPKTALSVIGHLNAQDLHRAISNNDIATISKVPGIGKKTAERLIIELRDKIKDYVSADTSDLALTMLKDPRADKIRDAMSTLVNLGYNQNTAQNAIKKTLKDLPEDIDLASLITGSLKNI